MNDVINQILRRLNNFTLSDKEFLESQFNRVVDFESNFIEAVKQYVNLWEEESSLDETYDYYDIQWIGEWVGRSAPKPVVNALLDWGQKPDNSENISAARSALCKGLRQL